MKSTKLLLGMALFAASFAANAAYTPGAGITGTPHDWSTTNGTTLLLWLDSKGAQTTYNTGTAYIDPVTGKQGTTKVTIGQCTKCHTPHQARSTTLLWNHTLQSTAYKWDVPATTAGTNYPTFTGDTYKGPTTKCLSCHDGLMSSTDGMWFNRANTASSKYVAAPGSLNTGHEVAEGADISRTHPVAMPYPVNGVTNTYNFVANGGSIVSSEFVANPMASNAIKLYNDDGAGNIVAGVVAGKSGMECSSCHDVHNGARVKDSLLLTGTMSGSSKAAGGYICNQCHVK